MRPILLASSSPYRAQLLRRLQIPFQGVSPNIDETAWEGETPAQLAERLAQSKAKALADTHPDHLIIGSDQVASLNGQPLGKPGNHFNALQQLKAARGQWVRFYTGLCVYDAQNRQKYTRLETYSVKFRPLSDEQLETYLQLEQPYDCAGSFKSEGLGIALFEQMQGDDPTGLIGLPLIALTRLLAQAGVDILQRPPR